MDNHPDHYQVASIPPRQNFSTEKVYETQSPVWHLLESEFAQDPEALALNVTLLLGLAARAGDVSDLHGQDTTVLLGLLSQVVYASLLDDIAQAGQVASPETYREALCLSLFDELQEKLLARKPDIGTYLTPDETRALFAVEMKSAAAYKRSLYETGVTLDEMTRSWLRRLRKDILELSEDWFIAATRQAADQGMPIDTSRFNLEIVHHFCDKDYWQHYCDSVSLAEARGDLSEWNRLNRIGRSHLRWIKDQRAQIEYMHGSMKEN